MARDTSKCFIKPRSPDEPKGLRSADQPERFDRKAQSSNICLHYKKATLSAG